MDQPGNINFEFPIINAAVGDKNLKVTLRREDGASGPLTVAISTCLNLEMMDISRQSCAKIPFNHEQSTD